MRKKLFIIVPLVLAVFASAAGKNNNNNDECKSSISYGQGHSMEQMNAGYNSPARYDVKCSWDYYLTGSFIYWQPKQKGLEFTRYRQTINSTGPIYKYSAENIDFDFHPGFKVGMGLNSDRDDWSLYLEYTRLTGSSSGSKTITITDPVTETLSYGPWSWAIGISNIEKAKGFWKSYLNLLDLELGRSYYVGTKLTFKPFIAARSGWIDQKYKATYTTSSDVNTYSNNKSDSWLLGPRAGIDTSWLLGEGFRLFGNFAFSVFYQDFKVKLHNYRPVQSGVTTLVESKSTFDKGYIIPNVEAAMGFGWGCYFSDEEWHFDISAGYEFHHFWNQNMIRYVIDYLWDAVDGEPADLTYNGLTISLQLDF